jgi:hypothetical protein
MIRKNIIWFVVLVVMFSFPGCASQGEKENNNPMVEKQET